MKARQLSTGHCYYVSFVFGGCGRGEPVPPQRSEELWLSSVERATIPPLDDVHHRLPLRKGLEAAAISH